MRTDVRKIRPAELAFDIDGVIADTFRAFVREARESYDLHIEYEAITEYDFTKVIDMDQETSDAIIERILEDPIGIGISPIRGAADVLRRLSRFGPLCLVTARTNREAIMEWIQQTLRIHDGNPIRLEATGTHENKLPVLLKHGIRYFVEDRLETCYLMQQSPVTPIVCLVPSRSRSFGLGVVTSTLGTDRIFSIFIFHAKPFERYQWVYNSMPPAHGQIYPEVPLKPVVDTWE